MAQRADARRNREKLVTAASSVIAENGVDASLEEIARRAGVGSATLHRHFGSRADLLAAVLDERVGTLCARAEQASPDAGAALLDWLHAVVAHAAAVRGFGPALTGYAGDPGFAPHARIHAAASELLDRAHEAGAVERDVTVEDLLLLANGIALATDSADRAERLVTLAARGFLSA